MTERCEPYVGQTVLYKLSEQNVEQVREARLKAPLMLDQANIPMLSGNPVYAGEKVPMMIVVVWPNEFGDHDGVNGQAILDGNDSLWVTSVEEGDEPGQWRPIWLITPVVTEPLYAAQGEAS